jgi:NADH:ubiquinone oxidoreductase subunit 3 (subunit A)
MITVCIYVVLAACVAPAVIGYFKFPSDETTKAMIYRHGNDNSAIERNDKIRNNLYYLSITLFIVMLTAAMLYDKYN